MPRLTIRASPAPPQRRGQPRPLHPPRGGAARTRPSGRPPLGAGRGSGVESGQKEAALALGLSPMQITLQVELPNAVRTTLPSIVSVFIGPWKDTTLLFIIEIIDFFQIFKQILFPNFSCLKGDLFFTKS